MNIVLTYAILALMVALVPMTAALMYNGFLYKYKKDQGLMKPIVLFGILLVVEIVFLVFLYLKQ